jgi:(2Fe-2S) ferredoxin
MSKSGQIVKQVLVCQNRTCKRDGAAAILAAFQVGDRGDYEVSGCGCLGLCGSGPIAIIQTENDYWHYWRLKSKQVQFIVNQHLQNGQPVVALLHPRMNIF